MHPVCIIIYYTFFPWPESKTYINLQATLHHFFKDWWTSLGRNAMFKRVGWYHVLVKILQIIFKPLKLSSRDSVMPNHAGFNTKLKNIVFVVQHNVNCSVSKIKINEIANWPVPITTKKCSRFLDLMETIEDLFATFLRLSIHSTS